MLEFGAQSSTSVAQSIAQQIELMAKELRQISKEVEQLPNLSNVELTNEQIVQLQKIDICSQKLADLASMADKLASNQKLKSLDAVADMSDAVTLEYMKQKLSTEP